MKNLNRKLSVIALSGMAVFGGVAVSGVQAFAAPKGASVKQEVSNVENVKNEIKLALGNLSGKHYDILEVVNSRAEAKKVLQDGILSKQNKVSKYIPKIKNGQLSKKLKGFLMNDGFIIDYKGNHYVIGLESFKK